MHNLYIRSGRVTFKTCDDLQSAAADAFVHSPDTSSDLRHTLIFPAEFTTPPHFTCVYATPICTHCVYTPITVALHPHKYFASLARQDSVQHNCFKWVVGVATQAIAGWRRVYCR